MINHYEVLGFQTSNKNNNNNIGGGARGCILQNLTKLTTNQISKAYKSKALELHPDKRPDDPNAKSEFQQLKSSYDILMDDESRKIFDAHLLILIVLVQSLQSDVDFSPAIFTFYEHFISTFLLSILAFYCERGKRPPLTLNVFLWAFFLGFLQIPLGHLLLTQSLSYISATFQSTALNTTGAVTFLMAVILGKEALRFYTLNGQAKLWGIVLSVVGASIMVLWSGPRLGPLLSFSDIGAREHVATRYRADMSLSAMMCFCGALQTAMIAGLTEKSSAWKANLYGSYELLVILYGVILNLNS
ncbi:Wat1-related protein [Thalictrum thalictroides]|uniref:WAT1-related protein n=1 Tax=Thalictrum thalictroides TaxID=46969 RepID=A0A7J6X7G4_THATH|nr:Wat1-related protein [Thalictrum thalictroides]